MSQCAVHFTLVDVFLWLGEISPVFVNYNIANENVNNWHNTDSYHKNKWKPSKILWGDVSIRLHQEKQWLNLFVRIVNLIAPGFISFRHKSLGLFLSYTRELGQFVFRIKSCFVGNLFIQQQEKVQYSNKESDIKGSIVCFDEMQMSFQFRCVCRRTALRKIHLSFP